MSGSDEQPQPIDQQATEAEVDSLYARGQEMERSETGAGNSSEAASGMGDIPGGAALSSLLSVAPFSAYLVHRAKLEYQHNTLQGRFRKYCQDHPWQNWICTVLDLVLRFIVVVIIMVVLVVFIAKALLPLPTISE